MDFWIAIATLGVIILVVLLVNRIATVMLTFTGMSREMARFQSRSAFCTVGFTTSESESVVNHPVRRRIIGTLMLFGNAGFVGIIATVVTTFASTGESELNIFAKMGLVIGLMAAIWAVAMSQWLDDRLFNLVGWALRRWTRLEAYDFNNLLQLSEGYNVTVINIEDADWPQGHTLMELRLADVGVNILGIHRKDGDFVGNPVGDTYVRQGDKMIVYGAKESVFHLDESRGEQEGWENHQRVLAEIRRCRELEGGKKTEGFIVSEVDVEEGDQLVGRAVAELDVKVLGVQRGETQCFIEGALDAVRLEVGDTIKLYGARDALIEFDQDENAEHGEA